MDLAYLRAHPDQLNAFLTHQRIRETPVAGGSICEASRLTLDDGTSLFAKAWPGTGPPEPTARAPAGFVASEAAGLAWLGEADGPPVPEVIAALPDLLALEWIDEGSPTEPAAYRFGGRLARLHRAGAPSFGATWPGFIGSLPLDNTPDPGPWPGWFASRRLEPYAKISTDRGALSAADAAAVSDLLDHIDEYAGPAGAEPPARLHGDLWPGNVLWSAGGEVYLIDPAAHGGHRETDLATLALFGGAPYLSAIVAGYQHEWPLTDGWQARIPLHQLHLLLVHTALFGDPYRDVVMTAVRATVKR